MCHRDSRWLQRLLLSHIARSSVDLHLPLNLSAFSSHSLVRSGTVFSLPFAHKMHLTELKPEELADSSVECAEGRVSDHLLSSGSLETSNICGDTSVLPRLGDQYQAEIPHLLSKSEQLQLLRSPINSDVILDASLSFGLGLYIQLEQQEFLVCPIGTETTRSMDSMNNRESLTTHPSVCSRTHDIHPEETKFKIVASNEKLEYCQEFARTVSQEQSCEDDHMAEARGYSPLPGSRVVSWKYIELKSFLLGLYIFGKNFVQVGKFVGTKRTGDILFYYYCKFHKSDEHRRWSEMKKIKGRKSIHGQEIFSGWRNQELLTRVIPSIPAEVQEKLLEAVQSFTEGRSSLEKFVFTLKDMVGLDLLVEAVGIGKGKNDLTGTVSSEARSRRTIPRRPEIPVGKELASLTYEDIIKFLKGSRFSKANSNDLFWEAVWPRLLARGWHSEQPKDLTFRGSKISLVFMIPGVNKFSRRKLTRGSHYFDSISDVLNTVALDPTLIELDSEGANESGQNCPTDQKRHCYLRPKPLNSSPKLFTIVDTSLFQGDVPLKVGVLQSLPVDMVGTNRASSSSGESDGSDTEDIRVTSVLNKTVLEEKPALLDLNILQFPPDFDTSDPFCPDMDSFNPKAPSFSSETKHAPDAPEGVSTNNARRQGTRNRMPTARALEAVACEFLSTKQKGRGTNTLPANDFP